MTRLRRKLEADPRQPVHLQTIRGEGYKLIAEAIFEDQG
jgi:two-component system phosphate regulon response regulator OmpR